MKPKAKKTTSEENIANSSEPCSLKQQLLVGDEEGNNKKYREGQTCNREGVGKMKRKDVSAVRGLKLGCTAPDDEEVCKHCPRAHSWTRYSRRRRKEPSADLAQPGQPQRAGPGRSGSA
jgi:hypothetical protein